MISQFSKNQSLDLSSPIIIGYTGVSGTKLVVSILDHDTTWIEDNIEHQFGYME